MLIAAVIFLYYGYCTAADLEPCSDVKKMYTECKSGSPERWEVTVSSQANCALPPPVKVASCDKTCGGGEILTDFTNCTKCQHGTYSPGNEKIYPVLDPAVFHDVSFVSTAIAQNKKKCDLISVRDKTVLLPPDNCYNDVTIPLVLLRAGTISLKYYYPDPRVFISFTLKTSNELSCNTGTTVQSSQGVSSHSWQTLQLVVNAKGRYLLEVRSTAFFNNETLTDTSLPLEAARLGQLSVTGIEPYTTCTNCEPGYVANALGRNKCAACPANQYSDNGRDCLSCNSAQYSLPGAGSCLGKVECQSPDYRPLVGPCLAGKSTVTTAELVPGKCSNTGPSQKYSCLECQPGSEKRGAACQFCAEGTHNGGGDQCAPCQPNTISLKGIYHVWWTAIPTAWKVRCPGHDNADLHGNPVDEAACWVPAGPFLLGRADSFQPIVIDFGEIEYSPKPITTNVVGLFAIKFQLICTGPCSFRIVKEVSTTTKTGSVRRKEVMEEYSQSVGGGEGQVARFNVVQSQDNRQHYSLHLSGSGSLLQLQSVNFTNTAEGGSSYCFPCNGDSCMECAPGMIYKDDRCQECPADTYHVITGSVLDSNYVSSCEPCPVGTSSAKGSTTCYTPCDLVTSSGSSYDISKLEDVVVYDQPDSYPDDQGNRYHYRYKMQLCSRSGTAPAVSCIEDTQDTATGLICQMSVITTSSGEELLTHPVNKADMLEGMTEEDAGLTLHFTTLHASAKCDKVATNLTLICNRDQIGDIRLVENTMCSLSFEHSGPFGCRKCVEADYKAITSSCVGGTQNVTHVMLEGVLCTGGVPLPPASSETCTPYQDTLIDSIKRFKLYVGIGVGTVLLLVFGLCILAWYSTTLKHRLDGYSQMNYAHDDNYMGATANGFAWEESGSDEDTNTTLYTKYKGQTPGAILASKLSKFNFKLGTKKYNRFDDTDIMQMKADPGI